MFMIPIPYKMGKCIMKCSECEITVRARIQKTNHQDEFKVFSSDEWKLGLHHLVECSGDFVFVEEK